MKKLFIFIPVLFFLSSCIRKTIYDNIPTEFKPQLVDNSTICFLDSTNNLIDTFNIGVEDEYMISEEINSEFISLGYDLLNNRLAYVGFSVSLSSTSVDVLVNKHAYYTIRLDADQTSKIKNNVNIHGVIYPTVYVLKPQFSMPDSLPSTVYYTFKNGIIRYDYLDGRHYEIINNVSN